MQVVLSQSFPAEAEKRSINR